MRNMPDMLGMAGAMGSKAREITMVNQAIRPALKPENGARKKAASIDIVELAWSPGMGGEGDRGRAIKRSDAGPRPPSPGGGTVGAEARKSEGLFTRARTQPEWREGGRGGVAGPSV